MKHLTVSLVFSLILPTLCYVPEDYGFVKDVVKPGRYLKKVSNSDRSFYTIWMDVNDRGKASFRISGPVVGNGIGSIVGNQYMAFGFGKPGLPMSGWEVPSTGGTSGYSSGAFDTDSRTDYLNQRLKDSMDTMNYQRENLQSTGFGSGYTIVNTGKSQGKFNGGIYGASAGESTVNNAGNYYAIIHTRNDNNNGCTENIEIKGIANRMTQAINDEFRPKCVKSTVRRMHFSGPEMLAGGIDQNFCAYGQIGFPNQLIVIQEGQCQINTYSVAGGATAVKSLGTDDCNRIKSLVGRVQNELDNGNEGSGALTNGEKELNDLVISITGSPDSAQTASTRPSRPAASAEPAGSSKAPTPKKQRSWLSRLWIAVKNVFRKLTFRPTKDE